MIPSIAARGISWSGDQEESFRLEPIPEQLTSAGKKNDMEDIIARKLRQSA